jgi:hypothetical protein
VTPAIRERRRPSHAVYVAMKSRINDPTRSVDQKPVIHKLAPREEKEKSWRPYLARERQHSEPVGQGGPDLLGLLYHAR